jgi:hypothetical protein
MGNNPGLCAPTSGRTAMMLAVAALAGVASLRGGRLATVVVV